MSVAHSVAGGSKLRLFKIYASIVRLFDIIIIDESKIHSKSGT
jgi:hypothetical protein